MVLSLLNSFAFGYIPDVALDYLLTVYHVGVTYEFNESFFLALCLKWQVLVPNIAFLDKLLEIIPVFRYVLKRAYLPELFTYQFLSGKT